MTEILLVFAFVCFVLAAIPWPPANSYWHMLVGAGLAAWVLSVLWPLIEAR